MSFAIQAKVRNIYHETLDPAGPLAMFDSFISDDICTTITGGNVGNTCADLAGNDPTGGGGGSGADPDEQMEPAKLLRRLVAVPRRMLPGAAGSIGLRLASAELTPSSMPSGGEPAPAVLDPPPMPAGRELAVATAMIQDHRMHAGTMTEEGSRASESLNTGTVAKGLPAGRARPEILAGDEVLATVILDRLLHNSHVLDVKGRSYRLQDLERSMSAA